MEYYNSIGKSISFDVYIVLIRCLIVLFYLRASISIGSNIPPDEKDDIKLVYEVIPVRVMIDGYKTFYLDALYTNNKQLYVDIAELFAMLNISCQSGKSANTLTGFIERENQTYLIDYEKGILKVGNRVVQSSHGLVKDKGILYLESTLFSDLFGITLNFNYRALTIQLKSKFELPFYKKQRIEKIRNSLSMIKGEEPADTILQRKYHLMKFGALDWSIATTQSETGAGNNQLALAVGTEILYGEADLSVN